MKAPWFTLQCFEKDNAFEVQGRVERKGPEIEVEYWLKGNLADLEIDTTEGAAIFTKGLWEQTCFELFLMPDLGSLKNIASYWEWNFSTTNAWAAFCFRGYRNTWLDLGWTSGGIIQQVNRPSVKELILYRRLRADFSPLLSWCLSTGVSIKAGLSAVLKGKDGKLSHWALVHTEAKPDFHQSRAFTIDLR